MVQGCGAPLLYVNGAYSPAGMIPIVDMFPPSALEAVEVYRSPHIPSELRGAGWPCAVIVVWTRR
jgi:hypothetical protein